MNRWQDRYTTLFGLLVLVAIVGQPVVSALGSLAAHAEPARIGPGLGLAAVAYAGYLALVRAVGPVALSAADASWRLLSPLPRRTVLGRTTAVMTAVAVLCGLALGVVLLSALGAPDHTLVRLAAALVLGLGATIGGMALGVMGQSSPAWDGWLQALTTASVAAAILLTVLGSGPGRTVLASVAGAPSWPAAALAAAVTAFLVRRAWREQPRVPARAIQAASVRTGRVTQAAVALDPGALTWAAEDAHWRGRTPGSKVWPVTGAWVLGWQELRRLGRRPVRVAVLGLSAGVPALAVMAGAPGLAAVLAFAGGLAAAVSATSGVRRDGDNPALLRLLAVGRRRALAVRAVPSALVSAAWLAAALGGMTAASGLTVAGGMTVASGMTIAGGMTVAGGMTAPSTLLATVWWLFGPACAPALAAAAERMALRRPVDHSMPVIDTPGGAIPTGPLLWAATGVDLAVLGIAPTLVAVAVQPADLLPWLAAQALTGLTVLGGHLWLRR